MEWLADKEFNLLRAEKKDLISRVNYKRGLYCQFRHYVGDELYYEIVEHNKRIDEIDLIIDAQLRGIWKQLWQN